MLILKRLGIWSLERLVEACLLGALLGCLVSLSTTDSQFTARESINAFWVFALVISIVLFIHGYYVTSAFFGVVWRSPKKWLYPTISCALFVFHTHIVFVRLGPDFTPEARALELPLALGGAGIVFCCALAGSNALTRWTGKRTEMNTYLAGFGIAILVFMLANAADALRTDVGDLAFRTYGLPFTFYREGGFIKQWIWRPGAYVWSGVIANVAVFAAAVLVLGRVWQAVQAR